MQIPDVVILMTDANQGMGSTCAQTTQASDAKNVYDAFQHSNRLLRFGEQAGREEIQANGTILHAKRGLPAAAELFL